MTPTPPDSATTGPGLHGDPTTGLVPYEAPHAG